MASQIISLTIVYSTVYLGTDQRKDQSSASLALVRGIHRWPVNSPHKWPVTRKMFPFDDVIMWHFYYETAGDVWDMQIIVHLPLTPPAISWWCTFDVREWPPRHKRREQTTAPGSGNSEKHYGDVMRTSQITGKSTALFSFTSACSFR